MSYGGSRRTCCSLLTAEEKFHWINWYVGRHVCTSLNCVSIDLNYALSPVLREAIILTNADQQLIPLVILLQCGQISSVEKVFRKFILLNLKTYPPVSISVSHHWCTITLITCALEIICIPQCFATVPVLNRVSNSPLICCFNTLYFKIIVEHFRHLMIWVTTLFSVFPDWWLVRSA